MCRIFLLKSKQSTPISSFLRLPPVHTLRGFNTVLGFMFLTRRLQCDVTFGFPIEHPEEVVVRTRHNVPKTEKKIQR